MPATAIPIKMKYSLRLLLILSTSCQEGEQINCIVSNKVDNF